jgi:hypothetical protein
MRTVNVHEAKTHFSRLIDAAHAGEPALRSIGFWRAQAELEGLQLVSLDPALATFPCRLLW